MKPVWARAMAQADIAGAIGLYQRHGGSDLAGRFVTEVEQAFGAIARFPAAGLPRYGEQLELPELRHHASGTFPSLLCIGSRTIT